MLKRLAIVLLLSALATGSIWAGSGTNNTVTNFTWTGKVSSLFGTKANWVVDNPTNGAPAPRAPNSTTGDDYVFFAGNVNNRVVNLGSTLRNIRGMQFENVPGADAFTFDVSGISPTFNHFGLNLQPDGMDNFDSHVQTFNVPITLSTYAGGSFDLTTAVKINAAPGGFDFTGIWSGGPAGKPTFDVNGGMLAFTGSGDVTVGSANSAGIIASLFGTGGLEMDGTGRLTLNGTSANTYSGQTVINSGSVYANKVNALGNGAALILNHNPLLEIGNYNQLIGDLIVQGGTINGGIGILNVSGTSNVLQSGTISAIVGGPGALTKSTTGTVTLTRANTYTGGTSVNVGTLRVINTSGSGTGTGAVTVNSGGTLSGNGSITSSVRINRGGRLAPGDKLGSFTTGNELWNGGGVETLAINQAGGRAGNDPGWTMLHINGTLTLGDATASNPFIIDLTSLTLSDNPGLLADFDVHSAYDWLMAETTGGVFAFDPNVFQVRTENFGNDLHGGRFVVSMENNNQDLHVVYVPEPATLTIAILGGFGLLLIRVWRRKP